MKNSKDILSSVLKTTQMGQVGIRSVLDTSMQPGLRAALESQLREYDSIETEAHTLATQRGWELNELDPGIRFMTDRMTRLRLNGRNTDSKIAGMMIQRDEHISILSQKLLDCETANIRQMQTFL